jgi:hypothetical protein
MLTLQQKLAQHQREDEFFNSLTLEQAQQLAELLKQGMDYKRVLLAVWNKEDAVA